MIMNSILGFEAGAVGKKTVVSSQGAEKTTKFSDFTDALDASDSGEAAIAASVDTDTPQSDSSQETEISVEVEIETEAAVTSGDGDLSVVDFSGTSESETAESHSAPIVQAATAAANDPVGGGRDNTRLADVKAVDPSLAPDKSAQGADLPSTSSRSALAAIPEKTTPSALAEAEKHTVPGKQTGEAGAPQLSETRSPAQSSGETVLSSEQVAVKPDQAAESTKTEGRRQASVSRPVSAEAPVVPVAAASQANAEALEQVVQRSSRLMHAETGPATEAATKTVMAALQGQADSSERHKASPRAGLNLDVSVADPLTGRKTSAGQTGLLGTTVGSTVAATGDAKIDVAQAISEPPDVKADTDAEVPVDSGKSEASAKNPYDVRATGSMPQQPALVTSLSQLSLMAGANASIGLETGPFSGAIEMTHEVPGLSQLLTEATIGTSATHRSELPRMVAAQVAEAFAAKGEQKVEVSLNPQELGRVSMRVVTSETGITMVIQTERPETGDLMRRHIHELAEEFREMGYEDISFEFSGGQGDGGQSEDQSGGGTANADALHMAELAEPATQNLQLGAAGVDMRV